MGGLASARGGAAEQRWRGSVMVYTADGGLTVGGGRGAFGGRSGGGGACAQSWPGLGFLTVWQTSCSNQI